MKTTPTLLLTLALLALCGCASITKQATATMADVQTLLSAFLPPDFKGDYHSSEKNMYFDYALEVDGIAKVGERWVFAYFRYDGNGHFPITPALSWTGEHHIELGKKPAGVP